MKKKLLLLIPIVAVIVAIVCIILLGIFPNNRTNGPDTLCVHEKVETRRKEATCNSSGYIDYSCKLCGVLLDSETLPIDDNKHEYIEENRIESTCKYDGSATYSCGVCGKRYTEMLPKDEDKHNWSEYTYNNDATPKQDGTKTSRCENNCGETRTITADGTRIPGIYFNTFEKVSSRYYKNTYKNVQTNIDFNEEIGKFGNVYYEITSSNNKIADGIYELWTGSNDFTIETWLDKGNGWVKDKTYDVYVYRNQLFTVKFETGNGGTVIPDQIVEEGELATRPTETISRAGATFDGWFFDFSQPIKANKTATAKWILHDNIPYKVEYYFETATGGYEIDEDRTQNLVGTTDGDCEYSIDSVDNFVDTRITSNSNLKINGDGSTVVKVYYDRERFTVTAEDYWTEYNEFSGGAETFVNKNYKYGQTVDLVAAPYLGCEVKWYGETSGYLATGNEFSTEITENIIARFVPKREMTDYYFSSNYTHCSIGAVRVTSRNYYVVPKYVTYISSGAFVGCNNIASLEVPFIGSERNTTGIYGDFNFIFGGEDYKVPSTLKTISITDEVYVNANTFSGLRYVKNIILSDNCETISGNFRSTHTSFNYNKYDNGYYIGSQANQYFALAYVDENATTINISETCKYIITEAFYGSKITNLSIPASVETIASSAITYCSVQQITFAVNGNLKSLGQINQCGALVRLKIPSTVTSFGGVRYMYFLETVIIPKSVQTIGSFAFDECPNLGTIYCESQSKPSGWDSSWNKIRNTSKTHNVVWGYTG